MAALTVAQVILWGSVAVTSTLGVRAAVLRPGRGGRIDSGESGEHAARKVARRAERHRRLLDHVGYMAIRVARKGPDVGSETLALARLLGRHLEPHYRREHGSPPPMVKTP